MQVSVETLSELGRKLSVTLSEDKVRDKVEARLITLAREIKLDGFRPGKVPAAVVRKRFAARVREEEVSDLLESSFREAIRSNNLTVVGVPSITRVNADEGAGLSFDAEFDVQPEIALLPIESLSVPKYVATLDDADVDLVIDRLRSQRKTWQPVDRPAAADDQVTFSFEGTVDGENFSNGRSDGVTAVIGSGQMINGFEDALIGSTPGKTLSIDLPFPENYGNAKLAGKTGHFEIEVTGVAQGQLPEVDESFVQGLGVTEGGVEAFRADVRANMERELENALQGRTKNAVFDAVLAAHQFPLPESAVREELNELLKPYHERVSRGEQPGVELEVLQENYQPMARRRVGLGLLLGRLVEANKLRVDAARVRDRVKLIAQSYEHPEMVESWYLAEPQRMQEVQGIVIEDQLLDLILSKAKVQEQTISFEEATKPPASSAEV